MLNDLDLFLNCTNTNIDLNLILRNIINLKNTIMSATTLSQHVGRPIETWLQQQCILGSNNPYITIRHYCYVNKILT